MLEIYGTQPEKHIFINTDFNVEMYIDFFFFPKVVQTTFPTKSTIYHLYP